MKNLTIVLLFTATCMVFSQEKTNTKEHNKETHPWSSGRPDGHAPISVMADHVHHKGEFMFSYRFMTMEMKDLSQGTENISVPETFNTTNYMVTPVNMTMHMHMLGAMYAPSDKITLMLMANYLENGMTLQMRMQNGRQFKTKSSGLGDLSLSALYSIFNKNRKALHAQVGVLIPKGSVEEKDMTPMSMGNAIPLPYPMQTGTGSFGTLLGVTYLGQCDKISWGHQITATINLNKNDQDYIFGNRYAFNNWIAAKLSNSFSGSLRIEGRLTEDINGESPLLNPMMVTTADTKNSGGAFINSGLGINYVVSKGTLKGFRLATEITTPAYQNLKGIQLKQQYALTFGAQYAFK